MDHPFSQDKMTRRGQTSRTCVRCKSSGGRGPICGPSACKPIPTATAALSISAVAHRFNVPTSVVAVPEQIGLHGSYRDKESEHVCSHVHTLHDTTSRTFFRGGPCCVLTVLTFCSSERSWGLDQGSPCLSNLLSPFLPIDNLRLDLGSMGRNSKRQVYAHADHYHRNLLRVGGP